ncbi:MAG: D-alanyl-D-alanine carboxypeptidase [Chloroflexi bacterium]|nr:D-alanyl-D-alanine carboxypeptidase [Chloroflexota bacterium]
MPELGRLGIALLLLSTLGLGFRPPAITDADIPTLRAGEQEVSLAAAAQPPETAAAAAIILDSTDGRIVFEKDARKRLAPASTTKIMTALLILRLADLSDVVTIVPEDLAGGTSMGLVAGEELTVGDLLEGMLLNSANEAAMAVARHVGTTYATEDGETGVARFVTLMNGEASRLGLLDTKFENPHGLDSDGHYSSAYDLAMLAREALKYKTFARIVATKEMTIEDGVGHQLVNTNQLLGSYEGVDGVKTGTTDAAGACLVASVTQNGHQIIAVVLGAEDRYVETVKLLDYFFASYAWIPLDLEGRGTGRYLDASGTLRLLGLREHAVELVPRWEAGLLRSQLQLLPSSDAGGLNPVGQLSLYLGSTTLRSVPVYFEVESQPRVAEVRQFLFSLN